MSAWIDTVNAVIGHMNEMQLEPALALLEPLCDERLVAESPADLTALSAALYLKGLVLDRQGARTGAVEEMIRLLDQT